MNKVKLRFITLISFFVLFALTLGLAIASLSPMRAHAATYAPTSIFWSRTGGDVKAYKADDGEETPAYVTFLFDDNGSVEYHRDLALKWYEKKALEEGAADPSGLANPGQVVYFSMEFSFGQVNFGKFTLSFQSAEENVTKEGQAVNAIVFEQTADGLKAYIKDASHSDDDGFGLESEGVAYLTVDATQPVKLSLAEESGGETCAPGEFIVLLGEEKLGKFTNVGGNFMEYRTSGTANTPITFSAELNEEAAADKLRQKVFMHSLNGQTLTVTGGEVKLDSSDATDVEDDGTVEYLNGVVTDDHPAALVLSEKLYAFSLGQRFSLDYEAIDVCDDSPDVSRSYYMLKKVSASEEEEGDGEGEAEDGPEKTDAGDAEELKYHKPDESSEGTDYKTLLTTNYFMPSSEDVERQFVSIRFTLDDGRTDARSEYIYLTWYADLDAEYGEDAELGTTLKVVNTIGNDDTDKFDYILVQPVADKLGPHFSVLEAVAAEEPSDGVEGSNSKSGNYQDLVDRYQELVKTAAEDLSSGSGAYFYLPSLRSLIESDYADYRNLRFTISYKKPAAGSSASTESSLRYNNLRFQVDKAGLYRFRVFASDASGKAMEYYDKTGKLVTVTSDNVWDIPDIPEFKVTLVYHGATIEDPGEQSIGNRGSSYSISSFDVIEEENCEKDYELYRFLPEKLAEGQSEPTYSDFVDNAEKYFTEDYKDCFETITEYNDEITEDDKEAWDRTFNDYHWDPDSSLSFTPVKSGYYVVRLIHTDPNYGGKVQYGYQVIEIRNPIDYTPGESNWLQNNVTSVVLFSISGVLAVAIVILCVVKPSDKNVEEVDLEKLKGKKAKK